MNRKANKANTDVEASTGHLSNMVAMSAETKITLYVAVGMVVVFVVLYKVIQGFSS